MIRGGREGLTAVGTARRRIVFWQRLKNRHDEVRLGDPNQAGSGGPSERASNTDERRAYGKVGNAKQITVRSEHMMC